MNTNTAQPKISLLQVNEGQQPYLRITLTPPDGAGINDVFRTQFFLDKNYLHGSWSAKVPADGYLPVNPVKKVAGWQILASIPDDGTAVIGFQLSNSLDTSGRIKKPIQGTLPAGQTLSFELPLQEPTKTRQIEIPFKWGAKITSDGWGGEQIPLQNSGKSTLTLHPPQQKPPAQPIKVDFFCNQENTDNIKLGSEVTLNWDIQGMAKSETYPSQIFGLMEDGSASYHIKQASSSLSVRILRFQAYHLVAQVGKGKDSVQVERWLFFNVNSSSRKGQIWCPTEALAGNYVDVNMAFVGARKAQIRITHPQSSEEHASSRYINVWQSADGQPKSGSVTHQLKVPNQGETLNLELYLDDDDIRGANTQLTPVTWEERKISTKTADSSGVIGAAGLHYQQQSLLYLATLQQWYRSGDLSNDPEKLALVAMNFRPDQFYNWIAILSTGQELMLIYLGQDGKRRAVMTDHDGKQLGSIVTLPERFQTNEYQLNYSIKQERLIVTAYQNAPGAQDSKVRVPAGHAFQTGRGFTDGDWQNEIDAWWFWDAPHCTVGDTSYAFFSQQKLLFAVNAQQNNGTPIAYRLPADWDLPTDSSVHTNLAALGQQLFISISSPKQDVVLLFDPQNEKWGRIAAQFPGKNARLAFPGGNLERVYLVGSSEKGQINATSLYTDVSVLRAHTPASEKNELRLSAFYSYGLGIDRGTWPVVLDSALASLIGKDRENKIFELANQASPYSNKNYFNTHSSSSSYILPIQKNYDYFQWDKLEYLRAAGPVWMDFQPPYQHHPTEGVLQNIPNFQAHRTYLPYLQANNPACVYFAAWIKFEQLSQEVFFNPCVGGSLPGYGTLHLTDTTVFCDKILGLSAPFMPGGSGQNNTVFQHNFQLPDNSSLRGSDLTRIQFWPLVVKDSDFSGANLSWTTGWIKGVSGTENWRTDTDKGDGNFKNADFTKANLTFKSFKTLDLTGANLENASLNFDDCDRVIVTGTRNLTDSQKDMFQHPPFQY